MRVRELIFMDGNNSLVESSENILTCRKVAQISDSKVIVMTCNFGLLVQTHCGKNTPCKVPSAPSNKKEWTLY